MSGSEAYSVITRERRVWTRATPCSSVPCADETNVCEADMAAVVRRVVYCAAGSRHVHAVRAQELGDSRGAPSRCSARSVHVHVVGYVFEKCALLEVFSTRCTSPCATKGAQAVGIYPARSSRRTHQGRANQSRSEDKAKPKQLKPNGEPSQTGRLSD